MRLVCFMFCDYKRCGYGKKFIKVDLDLLKWLIFLYNICLCKWLIELNDVINDNWILK